MDWSFYLESVANQEQVVLVRIPYVVTNLTWVGVYGDREYCTYVPSL